MRKLKQRIGQLVAPYPNWDSGVVEAYEYRTSIVTSENGTEQRAAARVEPRIEISFRADAIHGLAERVIADLNAWPENGLWVFPVYWRFVRLSGDHPAGTLTLDVDTATMPWWLVPGTKIVLDGKDVQEVATVASIAANTLTLEEVTTGTFYSSDKVCLGFDVRYASEHSLEALMAPHRGGTITLEVDPGSNPEWVIPALPDGHHEGYPVLDFKANWATEIEFAFENLRDMADNGRGRVSAHRIKNFSTHTQSFEVTGTSRDALDDVLHTFMACRGMLRSWWMPTRTNDMRLAVDTLAGASTLTVEGDAYQSIPSDEVWNTVCVVWPDGAAQLNRIDSVADASGDTVFTVRDPWERDIDSTVRTYWAIFGRFGSDRIEIEWENASMGRAQLSQKANRNVYVDEIWEGGPLWQGEINPYPNPPNITWPGDPGDYYTYVDLQGAGVPTAAIDEGLATIWAYMHYTGVSGIGSVSSNVRISCRFENDDGVVTGYREITDTQGFPPHTEYEGELTLGPVAIPVNSRHMQIVCGGTTGGSRNPDFTLFKVGAKQWGLTPGTEKLIWL